MLSTSVSNICKIVVNLPRTLLLGLQMTWVEEGELSAMSGVRATLRACGYDRRALRLLVLIISLDTLDVARVDVL